MSMINRCQYFSKAGKTSYSVWRTNYHGNKCYSSGPLPETQGVDVLSSDTPRPPKSKDVFGVGKVDNKLVAGEYQEENPAVNYRRDVIRSFIRTSASKLANEPEEKNTSFGAIRLDSANKVKYHAQFDPSNKRPKVDLEIDMIPAGIKLNTNNNSLNESQMSSVDVDSSEVIETEEGHDSEVLEALDKFFPPTKQDLKSVRDHKASAIARYQFTFAREIQSSEKEALKLWEREMEGKDSYIFERARKQWQTSKQRQQEEEYDLRESMRESKESPLKSQKQLEKELNEIKREVEEKMEKYKERLEKEEKGEAEEAEVAKDVAEDGEGKSKDEMSAFEYVQEMRNKQRFESKLKASAPNPDDPDDGPKNSVNNNEVMPQMKLDSQGFNSFIDYVPDLKFLRKDELIWMLKKRIVFNDLGLIAINKPHGLIVQGQIVTKENKDKIKDPNLANLLPDFSQLLVDRKIIKPGNDGKAPKLHFVHRLDRESTGVLLLATSSKVASQISNMLAKGQVEKHYYCITKGVPDEPEGIINIPIEGGTIFGKERQVLRPELREELRRIASPSRDGKHAVTYYKVRTSNGNAALLEVVPETGVKHQIRVHLGFGLRCPIIGDHKYSYLDRMVPQKLPNDMLKSLNVRPQKTRNIPLHLHCKLLRLQGFGELGRDLSIHASLPGFFKKTMRMLKLSD